MTLKRGTFAIVGALGTLILFGGCTGTETQDPVSSKTEVPESESAIDWAAWEARTTPSTTRLARPRRKLRS